MKYLPIITKQPYNYGTLCNLGIFLLWEVGETEFGMKKGTYIQETICLYLEKKKLLSKDL